MIDRIHNVVHGWRSLFAAAVLVLIVGMVGSAQNEAKPRLPSGVDPVDWEAYFDWGAEHLAKDLTASDSAILWASRLRPLYAEPYMRLASALEAKGDKSAAAAAYADVLKHISQDDYRRADIQHKIQLLAGSP